MDLKVNTSCIHHWIIEAADGVLSPGVCKYCGTKRRFKNVADYLAAEQKERRLRLKRIRAVYNATTTGD